ncbi:MAG: arylamine N-acetyltransferase [Acidobacteriia bacterium]|nr:arylamine N-acetyltransferase [Terriglobia bacterium]
MDVQAYLNRINFHGRLAPNIETLRPLQRSHLLTVPFENLSIHAHEPIRLEEEALFEKIVRRRRGGFCYELNGLFAALLRNLKFDVSMLSASTINSEGQFGAEFDHMTLLVQLEERWLVDVGFGDSFMEPLLLDDRAAQVRAGRTYRLQTDKEDRLILERLEEDRRWSPQYRFRLVAHTMDEYQEMCRYHQTSPKSMFTQRRICSRATPDGRVTLSQMRLIITRNGERHERELAGEKEYAQALQEHFGLVMQR